MSAPQRITLDKDKILSQIQNLSDFAKKNNWQFNYDPETDELVFGLAFMPRDSFLFNVNEDINLFVSPDSSVNGIFIEYFASNYLEHNKNLEPILKEFELQEKNNTSSKHLNGVNSPAKVALEKELIADTFGSLFTKDRLIAAI